MMLPISWTLTEAKDKGPTDVVYTGQPPMDQRRVRRQDHESQGAVRKHTYVIRQLPPIFLTTTTTTIMYFFYFKSRFLISFHLF